MQFWETLLNMAPNLTPSPPPSQSVPSHPREGHFNLPHASHVPRDNERAETKGDASPTSAPIGNWDSIVSDRKYMEQRELNRAQDISDLSVPHLETNQPLSGCRHLDHSPDPFEHVEQLSQLSDSCNESDRDIDGGGDRRAESDDAWGFLSSETPSKAPSVPSADGVYSSGTRAMPQPPYSRTNVRQQQQRCRIDKISVPADCIGKSFSYLFHQIYSCSRAVPVAVFRWPSSRAERSAVLSSISGGSSGKVKDKRRHKRGSHRTKPLLQYAISSPEGSLVLMPDDEVFVLN